MMDAVTPGFLQYTSRRIAAHLARSGSADQALAQWLGVTAGADWQHALCDSLLTDDAFAAAVAARSYRHGNGFLKLVLLDRGFKLRLHLWLPGTPCEENIHDHRWSIASTILAGALHSEIWDAAAGDGAVDLQAQAYTYHAARGVQPARALPRGRVALRRLGRTCHVAGDSYALPASALHRICNHGERLVATLMCSGPALAGHTRLFAGREGLQPQVSAERLDVAQLRAAIVRFAGLAGLPAARAA